MSSQLTILVYHPISPTEYAGQVIQKAPDVNVIACKNEKDIADSIAKADILFTSPRFPKTYLVNAKKLKWIQTTSAGVERLTLDAKVPDTVVLTRVNRGYGEQIAEFVMGHLLAITQKITKLKDNQRAKHWERLNLAHIKGKTLGIAGVGAIGGSIAARAHSFEMTVFGFACTPKKRPNIVRCYLSNELEKFLARLDFLVIALPLTRETRGLFGLRQFRILPSDAYILNIGRGQIIKEDELITALKQGLIAGAILDVFEQEPLPADSPLWEMENVTISPHEAGASVPAQLAEFFVENLRRFQADKPLSGVVDPEKCF